MEAKKFFKEGVELNEVEQLMQDGKFLTPEYNNMTLEEIALSSIKSESVRKLNMENINSLHLNNRELLCLVYNSDMSIEDKLVYTTKVYQQAECDEEKTFRYLIDKVWFVLEAIRGIADYGILTTYGICSGVECEEILGIYKNIDELRESIKQEYALHADFTEIVYRVKVQTTGFANVIIGSFDIDNKGNISNLYIEEADYIDFEWILCTDCLNIFNPFKVNDQVIVINDKEELIYTVRESYERGEIVFIEEEQTQFVREEFIGNVERATEEDIVKYQAKDRTCPKNYTFNTEDISFEQWIDRLQAAE